MKTNKVEVKTFLNTIECECGGTNIEISPYVKTANPPIYTYICKDCEKTMESTTKYPVLSYEIVKPRKPRAKKA